MTERLARLLRRVPRSRNAARVRQLDFTNLVIRPSEEPVTRPCGASERAFFEGSVMIW